MRSSPPVGQIDRQKGDPRIMYYSYHAIAKHLIANGHLTGYEYLDQYHGVRPCLLLYFDNHKPMPIRDYRWDEYLPIIKNAPER